MGEEGIGSNGGFDFGLVVFDIVGGPEFEPGVAGGGESRIVRVGGSVGASFFEGEFCFADFAETVGDFDAFVGPLAILVVMQDAKESGEPGCGMTVPSNEVVGALHDALDAGFVVGNGAAVKEIEILWDGEFVLSVELPFAPTGFGESAYVTPAIDGLTESETAEANPPVAELAIV